MHSKLSDGAHDPEELLQLAAKGGLDVIALTDHDLPSALPCGRIVVRGHPLWVLHGVELSGHYQGVELHLLVYFPGEMPEDFKAFCRVQARARADRHDQALEKLGLDNRPKADSAARAGERSLTRLHLAQAIVEAGHAQTSREAFDRFLGAQHGNVPTITLSFEDAVAAALAAGGILSWAHPSLEQCRTWSSAIAKMGVHGMEAYRPSIGKEHRRKVRSLARKNAMLVTGGSDWHGLYRQLGDFALQGQQAEDFTAALRAA